MNKEIESLYIHIPFCQNICDYCDFPKLQYFTNLASPYLDCLEKEIESFHISHPLKTIYIGGGTPTALEDDLFEKLLKIVSKYQDGVIEYTIEANPESLTLNKIRLMKRYGVNRLSIGVESTDDKILKALNRHSTYEDVKTAINNAKKEGIDNLNVDLILGLPHVLKSELEQDIDKLLELPITHISCYSLTVHEHTKFFLDGVKPQDSEVERALYDYVHNRLKRERFAHYEVSNWAKPGYESLHNMTYWKDEQYYGVGMGASGFIGNLRYTNTKSITDYLAGKTTDYKEEVTLQDDKEYFIMLNLRTIHGLSLEEYRNRFNEDLIEMRPVEISEMIDYGYLVFDEENKVIFPTYRGMMILDQLILQLI